MSRTHMSGSMPRCEKRRQGARIVSQAAVVAVGVRDTREKSVLGLAIGASETEAFWLEFCRSLARRGLSGVQLVISDAHEGLRSALSQVFAGATWQRSKVHFLQRRQRGTQAARAGSARGGEVGLLRRLLGCVPAASVTTRPVSLARGRGK